MTHYQLEMARAQLGTPCYVFDLGVLRARIDYLRVHLPEGVRLCYAVKANPFLARSAARWADRFEVCSYGEYQVCRAGGVPPEQLVLSGVYKSEAETAAMVDEAGDRAVYTAESEGQFLLLSRLAAERGRKLRVLLRLTSGNQFGMDRAVLERLIQARGDHPWLELLGIQFFSGTQKHSVKKLGREIARLNELLHHLADEYGYRARELEYGPGFPVRYFQGEDWDEGAYLAEFSRLLREELTWPCAVTLELGRSIAASCGTYLTAVADVKHNRGENYAILDGGMHHLVYFGQTMAMKLPHFQLLQDGTDRPEEIWNLCGALCTTNDILVKQLPVPALRVGDLFAFERTGAYCMTEGISLFLTRDLPAVGLLGTDGAIHQARGHLPTAPLNTPSLETR